MDDHRRKRLRAGPEGPATSKQDEMPFRYEGILERRSGTVIERKSLDGAEDIRVQELVLEFPLRIVFPAQFHECGQTTVTGVQLFW